MTVESTITKVRYQGNGAATEFPTGFAFAEDGHVRAVLRRPSGSGYEDLELTLDADFGLNGAGGGVQGTLTYPLSGNPLAEGETLTIFQDVPVTQEKSWGDLDVIDTAEIEKADDKLTRICLQMGEALERCVKMPVAAEADPADPEALLAAAVQARAARDAAVAAAAKVPAIVAGDADKFLTVKGDESGNEYVGGADARAKLGLSREEASATLGLGGAAVEDAQTGHRYVYVSQSGSDETGDGTEANPFRTVNAAIDDLSSRLMSPGMYATIRVMGYLDDHPVISIRRKNQETISLIGYAAPIGYACDVLSVDSTDPEDLVVVVENITDVSGMAVGEYAYLKITSIGADQDIKLNGCWKITEVDTGDNRVTLAVKDRSGGTVPGIASSGTLYHFKHGIRFASGNSGIVTTYANTNFGQIGDIALIGEDDPLSSSWYAVYATPGSKCWVNDFVGISGWHTGIYVDTAGHVNCVDPVISNCRYGMQINTGDLVARHCVITGCAARAVYAMYDARVKMLGSAKMLAGNANGIRADIGTFVSATGGAIGENGVDFSPAVNTEGNTMSYIYRP